MRLLSSAPLILDVSEIDGVTKFLIKPFEADGISVETFETTCSKKEVKKLFIKSVVDYCEVTGIRF